MIVRLAGSGQVRPNSTRFDPVNRHEHVTSVSSNFEDNLTTQDPKHAQFALHTPHTSSSMSWPRLTPTELPSSSTTCKLNYHDCGLGPAGCTVSTVCWPICLLGLCFLNWVHLLEGPFGRHRSYPAQILVPRVSECLYCACGYSPHCYLQLSSDYSKINCHLSLVLTFSTTIEVVEINLPLPDSTINDTGPRFPGPRN